MAHTQITKEQRWKIHSWLELGMSQIEMAERLKKDRSTISRETKRNRDTRGRYHGTHAHVLCRKRRNAGRRTIKKLVRNVRLRRAVLDRLRMKDSPEQVMGKRHRLGKDYVVHETIYQYLYTERPDLVCLLRQPKGKYRRRHGTKQREKEREWAKKTWITERPTIINDRQELGHFEGDTVKGKGASGSIGTHVERVSGYGLAHLLQVVSAKTMHEQTVEQFQKIPSHKRLSETDDNGTEFSAFEETERVLGMKIYFALPYHSWERGTNENWNGLLRQFFPKGTSFATLTQEDVDRAVWNLNHRPRKRLNYLSPHEVFIRGKKP